VLSSCRLNQSKTIEDEGTVIIQNIMKHPTRPKLSGKNLKSHTFLDDRDRSVDFGHKYKLIVYYKLISFPGINLMSCLCIIFIKLLFVFYYQDSFCIMPIVILMTLYIHFGVSLEYRINELIHLLSLNYCSSLVKIYHFQLL
jgi:hypothetical protein